MNLYRAYSIAIFKCALQVSVGEIGHQHNYAGAAGNCYQSITDLIQYMNEMRPVRNIGNSMPYMRYSLALQETR